MKEHIDTEKIAAIVIVYNPPERILANIASFAPMVSRLYVFDNSEIRNHPLQQTIVNIYGNKVYYHYNGTNAGMATALNTGIAWALKDGYEWMLTMDQDSFFENTAYFTSFARYPDKSNVAIFSPVHILHVNDEVSDQEVREKEIVMTSGNLLNLALHKKIGPFLEKLFIDEVDHEYCLRARMKGYKILEFSKILLIHELGEKITTKKNKQIITHNPQRVYYMTRNGLYLIWHYGMVFPKLIRSRILNLIMIYVSIIFHQKDKASKLKMGFFGLLDFLVGKYGKK
jgi:rhamnosyltransferase